MRVRRIIKTSSGTYNFDGELSQEELDVVITVGLGVLLERGALPILMAEDEEEGQLVVPERIQEQ